MSRKIRLAFVTRFLPFGGVEMSTFNICQGLPKDRFEIELCLFQSDGPMRPRFEAAGIPVTVIPVEDEAGQMNASQAQAFLEKLSTFDIAHSWYGGGPAHFGALAPGWAGVPVHVQTLAWPVAAPDIALDAVVLETDWLLEIQRAAKVKAPLVRINPGVNLERFDPQIVSPACKFEGPVVGRVSRLVPVKDPETFVRAAALVQKRRPQVNFLMVGDGPARAELETLARQLEARVNFWGATADVPGVLAAMDLFAYTTAGDSCPISNLEAMAMARPVISTRLGAIPEMVEEGQSGLLVPPRDAAALAEAICYLIDNPAVARQMGRHGRQVIEARYDYKRYIAQHAQLYEELFQQKVAPQKSHGTKPMPVQTAASPRRYRIALIYDNTRRPDTGGEYCKRALQSLCEVTHYLPTQLDQIPAGYDLYFHMDDGLGYSLPSHLHPSAWWVVDTHLQYGHDLAKARQFDFVFAAQRDGAQQLQADGIAQARWLPLACDPEIHGRRETSQQYDISFVGNVSFGVFSPDWRLGLLQLIKDNFANVFIGKAFFEEMARIYSASKIAFNCSVRNDINMRVFEALASGSLLVTDNLDDNGLAELFKDGEHLVTYTDGPDLLAKLHYYLEHDEERERIARRGHALALQQHTYVRRMQTILDVCLGASVPASQRAAETLEQLLAADDLAAAVSQLADRCDAELVALVRANAQSARTEGDLELADGLDNLAELLGQTLAARRPAPARPAPYSFARPEVARLVPDTARQILEVGCGTGLLGASLKARGNVEVVGIETNPAAAAIAAGRLDRVLTLDLNNLAALPFPRAYFDCVILADVLERLAEPAQVLRQLKEYLHPQGHVVISLPNVRHYSVLRNLLVSGRWIHGEARIGDRTHLRFFTWETAQELLHEAGLQGEAVEPRLTAYNPTMEPLLKAVAEAGGNAEQARLEMQTDQFVVRAKPLGELECPAQAPPQGTLVSIIILTLDNLALTRQCLESIEACTTAGTYELILVDNGSTDGTVEFLRAYAASRADVRVVLNAANGGFAAGNNQGLALAQGQYLLFLNNDTVMTDGWLERMLAIFERYPETGVVGPISNYVKGPQRISPPPYKTVEALQTFAKNWTVDHAGRNELTPRVIGFCLLTRRAVIDAIGGWDERFGNGNFEDDDFCLRASTAGFDIRIAQDVFIHHIGGQTFKQAQIDYVQSMRRNWELFKAKWGLPLELPLEHSYNLPKQPPPEALRPISLPDLKRNHAPEADGRWWAPAS